MGIVADYAPAFLHPSVFSAKNAAKRPPSIAERAPASKRWSYVTL